MEEIYNREAYLLGRCLGYLIGVANYDHVAYRRLLKNLGFTEEELDNDCWAKRGKEND